MFEVVGELLFELGVFFGAFVFVGKLADGDHEGFGDVGAAVGAEASFAVGDGFDGFGRFAAMSCLGNGGCGEAAGIELEGHKLPFTNASAS